MTQTVQISLKSRAGSQCSPSFLW